MLKNIKTLQNDYYDDHDGIKEIHGIIVGTRKTNINSITGIYTSDSIKIKKYNQHDYSFDKKFNEDDDDDYSHSNIIKCMKLKK